MAELITSLAYLDPTPITIHACHVSTPSTTRTMMPSGSHSPLDSLSTPSSSGRLYRVSKACENCRVRRIKCQPPYPCEGCRSAHLTDCHVRDRARPNRSTRQAGSSQTVRGTSHQQRIRPIQNIDDQLARLYADKTGVSIDLTVAQGHTHPLLDTDTPLPPLPDITPRASLAIQAFVIHCLPTCSFLTPARINHLFERYVASPTSLGPDQLALVYACLACGFVRLQYFGGHERNATSVPQEQREDVPWYRHAVHTLTAWGSTTFTSLHALSVLWFYTTLVSTTASRFVVSWLVSQARELGLHHEQTAMAVPQVPSDQAAFMLYIILYAHGHTISLSDLPPVIKVGEFDTMIFKIQTPQEETVPAGLYPSPAIYDLTLLLNQLLLNLHNHDVTELTVEWLLRVEERLALWSRSWAAAKQTGGRIDLIVGILYDWGRIMLRSSTLDDERFTMSSMAILARASTQILTAYHEWYSTQSFNLMWQQLRHVITCAHITILCHVRFELLKEEAEANLVKVFWILALSEPRWTDQVISARSKIEQMASVFGLVTPTQRAFDDELFAAMANEATQLNNGDYLSGMLFTDPVSEYGNALEPMKFDWFS